MSDRELFSWMKENLYVAVVCDILDEMGYRNQAMHQRLRPLDENHCVIVGRARTFRWMETDYVVEDNPYGAEIEAMDSLKEGDVVVHSTDNNHSPSPICGAAIRTVNDVNEVPYTELDSLFIL